MAKYNWETIKRQYIQGIKNEDGNKTYPSYEDLSKLHGPSKSTISSHSTNDPDGSWEEQRERYSKKIEQKVIAKKSEIEAENIVEDDLLCESVGRKLIKIIEKKIKLIDSKLDKDEWVSGIEILNTSSAARNAQEIIKTSQGEASNISKIEGVETHNQILLTDPDYIQAKKRAMDDYYAKQQGTSD